MDIIVGSKHLAVDISSAVDVSGREHLVIVAKGTWKIPAAGERPRPIEPQPFEHADVYVGEPGLSAMLYGSDLARFKPRCDVLFNASAHANGKPVQSMEVVWQVGPLRKGLRVHGSRNWRKRLGIVSLTDAEPFSQMPLHFGNAFGGMRTYKKGWGETATTLVEAHPENPDGIGWFGSRSNDEIDGQPAPMLESLDDAVRKPNGNQRPIAFSAIARHWHPRPKYGGTYDDKWQREIFPFLPEDFDEQFNQCAPEDQQMPYPKGGEQIILRNMMAGRSDVRFRLPKCDNVIVRILRSDYSSEECLAVPDTIYFEPNEERFSVVWRLSTPVKRRLNEFHTIAVGPVSEQLWRERSLGLGGCMGCKPTNAAIEGRETQ
ncbi:DUF2169 domain-containing protein [Massilia sp. CCM 8733]|uniref:DUF2169 domain-containing protein n=1 Tax=Massilia mucilaginosa TaxID=2609282 RepID=A0ABX0P275_9BURK|nr:DUF2169 domain-containing protein [Massilia mucilaginosa]